MTTEIEGMAAAQAALTAATEKRDALNVRIAAAGEAVVNAQTARSVLVQKVIDGKPVGNAEIQKADDAILAAERSAALLRDALPSAERGIAAANEHIMAVRKAEGDRLFAVAIARRIAVADKIDALSADLAAAAVEFAESGTDINAAWVLGRVPLDHEIASMRNAGRVAWALPIGMQNYISKQGYHSINMGAAERSIWGNVKA